MSELSPRTVEDVGSEELHRYFVKDSAFTDPTSVPRLAACVSASLSIDRPEFPREQLLDNSIGALVYEELIKRRATTADKQVAKLKKSIDYILRTPGYFHEDGKGIVISIYVKYIFVAGIVAWSKRSRTCPDSLTW